MGNKVTNKKVVNNIAWRLAERFGAQGVSFVVSIVLARLLAPEAYGTVALITVITNILQVFVDSGLGNALIQSKESDTRDFSTVFYFNMGMCIFLYGLLFLSAPLIAKFYDNPDLVSLVRVLGLTLIISGVKNVQQAYVSRSLMFKRFFFATLGGTLVAAGVGIVMAYKGFGAWALVAQYLTNLTIDTLVLWITVKWRPTWEFSLFRLKVLFSFGWKLLAASFFSSVYDNLRSLLIGKFYTSEDLAFYNKGDQYPGLITINIASAIDSVMLPTVSREQDDKVRVKAIMKRSIKTCSYIISPMLVGFAVCGEAFVKVLLTDKWLPILPYVYIFCFIRVFYPINSVNIIILQGIGRSDLVLKLNIIKRIAGVVTLLVTVKFGVLAIAIGQVVLSLFSQIINAMYNKKLLNYSHIEQLGDLLPCLGISCLMGVIVYPISLLPLGSLPVLILQVITGVVVYVLISFIFKFEPFYYCLDLLKSYIKKK